MPSHPKQVKTPGFVDLDSDPVDRVMRQGISKGVFPGAVLLVSLNGGILFHRSYGVADRISRRPVTLETVFDLASLTKPLATTLAVLHLFEKQRVDPEQPVGAVLPRFSGTDKHGITVRQLLNHTSGLPDYRPYYKVLSQLPAEQRPEALTDLLVKEPLDAAPGEKTLYSDLGFMILARLVSALAETPFNRFISKEIYDPLGLSDLFFIDRSAAAARKRFAATEHCPWREKTICGEVHDENAWAAGGFDGQAGLFGTAAAVGRLSAILLRTYLGAADNPLFSTRPLRMFWQRDPVAGRALGFDMPDAEASGSGSLFSPRSVGHLGFTGTSFWVDPDRTLIVVLLTNRIHPTRENTAIRSFRPLLHDTVVQSLTGVAGGRNTPARR